MKQMIAMKLELEKGGSTEERQVAATRAICTRIRMARTSRTEVAILATPATAAAVAAMARVERRRRRHDVRNCQPT